MLPFLSSEFSLGFETLPVSEIKAFYSRDILTPNIVLFLKNSNKFVNVNEDQFHPILQILWLVSFRVLLLFTSDQKFWVSVSGSAEMSVSVSLICSGQNCTNKRNIC